MSNKYESLARACVTGILDSLEPLLDFIYEHESSFLEKFCGDTATDIISVSFNSELCKFTFLVDSGASIVNSIVPDELIDWMLDQGEGDFSL